MHQLVLRKTDAAPVADADAVHNLGVLARRSANLTVALTRHLVNGFETHFGNQLRKLHVHGGSHTGADVRRTARHRAELGVHHEHLLACRMTGRGAHAGLDRSRASAQTTEHTGHVAAHLHRDDAQVVAFVHPVHELLRGAVEHTATVRPMFVVTGRCLHLVLATEQLMAVNQSLSLLLRHRRVQEELACQIALQAIVHLLHQTRDLLTRFPCAAGVQREHRQVPGNADTRRNDLGLRAVGQLHSDLGWVHALTRRALQVAAFGHRETLVVRLDHRIEEILEVIPRLAVSRMASHER